MTKKEFVREKLELLKSIGITSIDDLLSIVNFMPGGDDEYNSDSQQEKKHFSIEEETDFSLEVKVKNILYYLGVPAHILGYTYLTDAIMLVVRDKNALNKITYVLYPEIANKYETTANRVERAMRSAIETAWNRGDVDILTEVFGNTISMDKGKPTNSEFIALISERIRMGIALQ